MLCVHFCKASLAGINLGGALALPPPKWSKAIRSNELRKNLHIVSAFEDALQGMPRKRETVRFSKEAEGYMKKQESPVRIPGPLAPEIPAPLRKRGPSIPWAALRI